MAKRVEYQDMVDLDGYRKAVADSRAEYKAFVDDVVRLNKTMEDSIMGNLNALQQLRKLNASGSGDSGAIGQQAAGIASQLKDQRAAISGINQLEKALGTLYARQEQVLNQYVAITGNTAKDIAMKKRLANELVSLQSQTDRLDKSMKVSGEGIKEVTGTYNKLHKELKESRDALRSLENGFDPLTGKINRTNATAVTLAQKITLADSALKKMDSDMGTHTRKVGQYENALQGLATGGITGLLGSLGLLGVALAKAVEVGGMAIDKMSQFEQARGGLKGVTKDATDLANTQEFLEVTADRLGLQLLVLEDIYKGMKVGTRGTALEGKEAERIFKAFATRLAELKAPADKAQAAMKALSDMLSKGTIAAEEIKGQLGDAMPGALSLFAEALGVSTEKLLDMMKNGDLLAVDVLPKVADQLEKTFNGSATENVDALVGATARLDNQTGLLLDTFNQKAGITAFFAEIKNGIADTLKGMRAALQSGDWLKFIDSINTIGASAGPGGVFLRMFGWGDGDKARGQALQRIEDFKQLSAKMRKAQLDILEENRNTAHLAASGTSNPRERQKALEAEKEFDDELRTLTRINYKLEAEDQKQRQIDARASDKKYHEQRVADVVKQAQELTKAERDALVARFQGQISSDQAKARTNPNLVTSLNRDIAYAKEFIKAIQDVNKELEKKDKKDAERDAKSKTRAAQLAADQAKREAEAQLQNSIGTVSASTGTQLGDLSSKKEQGLIDEQQFIIARYNITVSGINKRMKLLKDAGKEETDDYQRLYKELSKADADYQKDRADLQEKAFKKAVEAVGRAIESDAGALKAQLADRLGDLQIAYKNEETAILDAVGRRQISEAEGERRLTALKVKLLKDIADETRANSSLIEQMAKTRLDNLANQLRAEGKSEIDIAKALVDEKVKIEKEHTDAIKQASDERVKINDAENEQKRKSNEQSAKLRQQLEEKVWEGASKAVNAYFDISSNIRAAELDKLERDKQHELDLSDGTESSKAAIEEKFDKKSRALKRQQAVADRQQAIFNVLLSTSQAAFKTFAEFGYPFGLPLAIAIGALGAIEVGVIASRKLPEFWKGTSDAPEGPAWVGEQGYELIESKKGGKPTYRLAAEKQIAYLNAHDRVMTHEETKRFLRVNTEIAQEVRTAPGGSLYQPVVNSGLSEESMRRVMQDTIGSQVIEQTTFEDGELKKYILEKQQRTQWLNSYFSLPKKGR